MTDSIEPLRQLTQAEIDYLFNNGKGRDYPSQTMTDKKPEEMTDDELFMAIKEQVNLSRNTIQGHDRKRTRAIAEEAKRRGWNLRHYDSYE